MEVVRIGFGSSPSFPTSVRRSMRRGDGVLTSRVDDIAATAHLSTGPGRIRRSGNQRAHAVEATRVS